jgi:hypothetical protein
MHAFVADATLRLEFVKKVHAKIAENDPKFLSFEISILFLLVLFLVLVLISMCISVREGEATKLKLVPSTSESNRALPPMPKAAQANNHFKQVNQIQVQQLLLVLLVLEFSDGLLMKSVPY